MTIRGEISKRSFRGEQETKHYETVTMQMGRVQLDSDWNEAFEMLLKARSRVLRDVVGKHGSPNDGFLADTTLVLDHLESKEGWSFSGDGRRWLVDYFEKVEGKGSFRFNGDGKVSRAIPPLLKNIYSLRQRLVDKNDQPGKPRLQLHCKASSTSESEIILSLMKAGGANPLVLAEIPVPCGDWQTIPADLPADVSSYDVLFIEVTTKGSVFLDRLALDPGLVAGFSSDFYVQGGDGTIGAAGRYYVDGLACLKEGFETYRKQKDYPEPAAIQDLTFPRLVYLDAWRRTVTAVEDPGIREVALGGPDTCAREQLVSQVKVVSGSSCAVDIRPRLRAEKTGTLTAKLSSKAEQDKCDFRPELDYSGLNNSLYRIEIHAAGDKDSATFKWSRNNGADLAPVTAFAGSNAVVVPDDRILCCGDVVELCDDVSDLADFADASKSGMIAAIKAIDHDVVADGVKITLDRATAPFRNAERLDAEGRPRRHPKLRKWHGIESVKDYVNLDPDGTPSKELEHGIRLAFSKDFFYHGDYWQFAARVNTRSIGELDQAPPAGPAHHYAPLAVVKNDGGAISFTSCRNLFPPLTGLEADDIRFDAGCCDLMSGLGVENVQQAVEALCRHGGYDAVVIPGQSIQDAINSIGAEGGSIYLAPGTHIVTRTIRIEERRNLVIRGDGPATRVVYIPEFPEQELKEILEATEEIEKKNKEIEEAADPEKKEALIRERYDLEIRLEIVLRAYLHDLFRVCGSENIVFRDFLMLSFGADSLVAVTDPVKDLRGGGKGSAKSITVSDCGVYNLPVRRKVETGRDRLLKEKGNIRLDRSAIPCIRAVDCCDLRVEDSRLAGNIGVLQQGAPDVLKMPLVDGMLCRNNRLRVVNAGFALLEGMRIVIRDNTVLPLGDDVKGLCEQIQKGEADPIGESRCGAEVEKTVDKIVDKIEEALRCCLSNITPEGEGVPLLLSYVLRMSRIERNLSWGDEAITLFYSEENEIIANTIHADATAAGLAYSFKTTIAANKFIARRDVASGEPEPPAAPAGLAVDEASSSGTNQPKTEAVLLKKAGESGQISRGAVMIQFADRLAIEDNEISGENGIVVRTAGRFENVVRRFADFWGLESTDARAQARIVEARRFAGLMGLQPAIRLVETIMKPLFGNREVDLIAMLMGRSPGAPFGLLETVTNLLKKLCDTMLRVSVVSRSVISRNRFNVERYGIRRIQTTAEAGGQQGSDFSFTLGGVRIMDNRFSGAGDAAILWKSCSLLANPELNGFLLTLGYEELLRGLKTIREFLQRLNKPQTGVAAEASPLNTLMATFVVYAVGQKCPERETAAGPAGDVAQPVNPYADALREIIEALDDLIAQVEGESVRENIADLSCNDDRIRMNRIRGKGNGIHTNIANCIIESNRIDIEAGRAAIAEIFSIGREFTAYASMLDCANAISLDAGASRDAGHPLIGFLGDAMMNLNPHALSLAGEMLADKPQEWAGLDGMLMDLAGELKSPVSSKIAQRLMALSVAIREDSEDRIKAASTALISELRCHLTGYGIIAEAPGVHVVGNRIEALSASGSGENFRRAPGGILLSGGEGGIVDRLAYLLLIEEFVPLENFNIGGQGTLFRGNSVQWGTGHGISLSSCPLLSDVGIENNEIQNHGLSGILCDRPAFLSLTGYTSAHSISYPLAANRAGRPQMSLPPGLFMSLFFTDRVRIVGNEINQCFLNEALACAPEQPRKVIFHDEPLTIIVFPVVFLGGVMVRNAAELTCSGNTIRSCGSGENPWLCSGSVLINCANVGYRGNRVLANGKKGTAPAFQPGSPRGGALFLGPAGHLNILSNEFGENNGITAAVAANYEGILRMTYRTAQMDINVDNVLYGSWNLGQALVSGNGFTVDDSDVSGWAKIRVGDESAVASVKVLNFSNNNISFQGSGAWGAVALAAAQLLFNGNSVAGAATLQKVLLAAGKGIGAGNILHREPEISGDVKITDMVNNEHNLW